MLSKILLISCFCSRIVIHGFPFLMAAGTFNKLKSVGMIDDNSFHSMGIETVAEAKMCTRIGISITGRFY